MNKYGLSKSDAKQANDLVASFDVFYSIDDDKIRVDAGVRRDAKDDEFGLRVAQQVENALRQLYALYEGELNLIEQLAGVVNSTRHPSGRGKRKKSLREKNHPCDCECLGN